MPVFPWQRPTVLGCLRAAAFLLVGWGMVHAQTEAGVLHRDGWSFDRSMLVWPSPGDADKQKQQGTIRGGVGWAEYDFELTTAGWYELWETGGTSEWPRDIYIDGKLVYQLTMSDQDDVDKGWYKDFNLHFAAGKHTLRFRRLNYPGVLAAAWELRAANDNPAGCIRVSSTAQTMVHAGEKAAVVVSGGTTHATKYDLVLRNESTHEVSPVATVEYPVSDVAVDKTVNFDLPKEGVFSLLAQVDGKLLRPADLKGGQYIVIDRQAPAPAQELKTSTVVDIDCTAAPPAQGYWEKDGATHVVDSPAGRYRETSGQGSDSQWGTDGFSYQFDLPDTDHIYRLRVDYPDDDRRSMGFWVNDGAKTNNGKSGTVGTGGAETGDRYLLTHKMQTHEAFFYPHNDKGLIVAVINLVPGFKAAAAHIRIDRVDSALPSAISGPTGGRNMGFYFEEPGRWVKFFGGEGDDTLPQIQALDRWAQWNRYIGANLMYPTINVYQGNHFPSRILEGYFNRPINEVRLVALTADKYGQKVIPEFHMSGQTWFDRQVMGVSVIPGQGRHTGTIEFSSKEAEDCVIRDYTGNYKYDVQPFVYNALNPKVQDMYISVLGELADSLADCPSFEGISSRMMFSWVWQGWNALPGLNWGYDDWTVGEFEKDTGIKVPGEAGSPERFHQRFVSLTGQYREQWLKWRCDRIFAYHQRLRDRIQKAKPSAKIFFTYFTPDWRQTYSPDMLGQMREMGIDYKRYANESGIVLLPSAFYGRRFSTPIQDATKLDPLFDPDTKTVASLGERSSMIYSDYYEVNKHLDWTKLGGKVYPAFDTCSPSGANEREMFALAVADADVKYLVTGGSGWIFGTPEIMQPFLREYRALPDVSFAPLAPAVDPVAVWQGKDKDGAFWFYAVNRLPVSVTAHLSVGDPAAKVIAASTGESIAVDGGKFSVALEPYMMRSFRGKGVSLSDCQVDVPPDFVASLKPIVASAKQFRQQLAARSVMPGATSEDTNDALAEIDEAAKAFDQQQYGKVRASLQRLAALQAYAASGQFPPNLLDRSQPLGLPAVAGASQAPQVVVAGAPGQLKSVSDLTFDADGNLWAGGEDHVAEFGPDGHCLKALTLFAPYRFDDGDIRHPTLIPPEPANVKRLRVADKHLIVQQNDSLPWLYDMQTGRAVRADLLAYNYPGPTPACRFLGADGAGNLGLAAIAPTPGGIWLTAGDGKTTQKISDLSAVDGAVDDSGRIYVADEKGITVISSTGAVQEKVERTGITRLAVSHDGSTLIAAVNEGSALAYYHRDGSSPFSSGWTQPLPGKAAAIALGPQNELAFAVKDTSGGDSVKTIALGADAPELNTAHEVVPAPSEQSAPSPAEATQLKVYDGAIYYAARGKLMKVTPGDPDKIAVAYDAKFSGPNPGFEAFCFDHDGNLYLSSNWNGSARGINLYRCAKEGSGWSAPEYLNQQQPIAAISTAIVSDLAVDAQGAIILKMPATGKGNEEVLYRWKQSGGAEEIADLGGPDGSGVRYGLAATTDGGIVVASGDAHSLLMISPDGKVAWTTQRVKSCAPGSTDLLCPAGVTIDASGHIWATDPVRDLVMSFDAMGHLMTAEGGFGDSATVESLTLNNPTGIAAVTDSSGKQWLYIADVGNGRLLKRPINGKAGGVVKE